MLPKDGRRQKGPKPRVVEGGAGSVPKPRHHGSGPKFFSKWVTRDILQKHFHLPMEQAALTWGVSTTIVKRVCRTFGIERWPYRQIQSAYKTVLELEKKLADTTRSSLEKEKIKAHIVELRAKIDDLRLNPNPNPSKKRPSAAVVSRGPERPQRTSKRVRRTLLTASEMMDAGDAGEVEGEGSAVLDGNVASNGRPSLLAATTSTVPCGVPRSLTPRKTVSRAAARAMGASTASTASLLTAPAKRRMERSAAVPASIPVATSIGSSQKGLVLGKGAVQQNPSRGAAAPPNVLLEPLPSTPAPIDGGTRWNVRTQEVVRGVAGAKRGGSHSFGDVDVARVSGDDGTVRATRSLSTERSGVVGRTVGHLESAAVLGVVELAQSISCPPPGSAQNVVETANTHHHHHHHHQQQQQQQQLPSGKLGIAKSIVDEGATFSSRGFPANTPTDTNRPDDRSSFRAATPPMSPWGTSGRGSGTPGTVGTTIEEATKKPAVATTLEDASLAAILLDIDIPDCWSSGSGSSSISSSWNPPLPGSSVNLDIDEAFAFAPGDLFPDGGFLADAICAGMGQQGDLW